MHQNEGKKRKSLLRLASREVAAAPEEDFDAEASVGAY